MKRKFSSKLAPITLTSFSKRAESHNQQQQQQQQCLDSPECYALSSPTTVARPPLSPRLEAQLRESCAIVLQEFKPSTQLYEEIVQSGYFDPQLDGYIPNATKREPKAENSTPFSTSNKSKRRPSDPKPGSCKPDGSKYVHVPTNAANSYLQTATSRQASVSRQRDSDLTDPLDLTLTGTISNHSGDAISNANHRALASHPRASAAGCDGSRDTSSSTTRTNTTFDNTYFSQSTAVTTANVTPGLISTRVSEQILSDPVAAMRADTTAAQWMAQELARRRTQEKEPSSQQHQCRQQAQPEYNRPASRASSIRGSIKEYIRPRSSCDSIRSSYSASSNTPSFSKSAGTWWNGVSALRRRGSFSSWRSRSSSRGDGEDEEDGIAPDQQVDLNRALPPLPGLNQWEAKRKSTSKIMHVAHLMRGGAPQTTTTTTTTPPPASPQPQAPAAVAIEDDGHVRPMSHQEETARADDLKRAVMEKMRTGSLDAPPVSPRLIQARRESILSLDAHSGGSRRASMIPRSPPLTSPGVGNGGGWPKEINVQVDRVEMSEEAELQCQGLGLGSDGEGKMEESVVSVVTTPPPPALEKKRGAFRRGLGRLMSAGNIRKVKVA
ncbi:MAG: hypothetical protein M1827_006657 [Pycnora praestabilis]|nr:MAG: hypothetical protein M1827_006657 [Pycnora praestabilis]